MSDYPELVVMLTHNDMTVKNAEEIFLQCKQSKAKNWGFKELPLPLEEMRHLVSLIHECGKTAFLEVVSYTEEEGLDGAKIAVEIGCDIMMGTKYYPSIHSMCKEHGIKYMPFAGEIVGRPSVLTGTIEEIVAEGKKYAEFGVDGIDLLGYRFSGDAVSLIRQFVKEMPIPVCVAGSIDSELRLDQIKAANPWSFTIGSAFFDNCFGSSHLEQIDFVCDYMAK